MSRDCNIIGTDRRMRPSKVPFSQLPANHDFTQMTATAEEAEGGGPYEVHVKYRDHKGRWREGSFTSGRSMRADISPNRSFTPTVALENNSEGNLRVTVCQNFSN